MRKRFLCMLIGAMLLSASLASCESKKSEEIIKTPHELLSDENYETVKNNLDVFTKGRTEEVSIGVIGAGAIVEFRTEKSFDSISDLPTYLGEFVQHAKIMNEVIERCDVDFIVIDSEGNATEFDGSDKTVSIEYGKYKYDKSPNDAVKQREEITKLAKSFTDNIVKKIKNAYVGYDITDDMVTFDIDLEKTKLEELRTTKEGRKIISDICYLVKDFYGVLDENNIEYISVYANLFNVAKDDGYLSCGVGLVKTHNIEPYYEIMIDEFRDMYKIK